VDWPNFLECGERVRAKSPRPFWRPQACSFPLLMFSKSLNVSHYGELDRMLWRAAEAGDLRRRICEIRCKAD